MGVYTEDGEVVQMGVLHTSEGIGVLEPGKCYYMNRRGDWTWDETPVRIGYSVSDTKFLVNIDVSEKFYL